MNSPGRPLIRPHCASRSLLRIGRSSDGSLVPAPPRFFLPTAPRVFARVFCDPGTLPGTVRFYEALTSVSLDMDMDIPESGLHVVAVGPFLILEMDKGKLDRAGGSRTHVTILNANLDDAVARQVAAGAQIVQQRWDAPRSGSALRHPDGLLAEYLEHRPSPDDAGEPGPAFR